MKNLDLSSYKFGTIKANLLRSRDAKPRDLVSGKRAR
jgi:hypothetical protein